MLTLNNINLIRTSSYYRSDTLKSLFISAMMAPLKAITQPAHTEFFLKDINLTIAPGERIAILGKNGSGKSTLCRLLAEQLFPSSGNFRLGFEVSLFSQIENTFFNELSGRENLSYFIRFIYSDQTTQQKAELLAAAIVFSELGPAIDRQVETYSTGMLSRLALSLILAKKHDLLILDEMNTNADQGFREKVAARLGAVIGASNTVVIVSHVMDEVTSACSRGLVMDQGRIVFDGEIKKAVAFYCLLSHGVENA